jgi:hypothetical protein
MEDQEDARRSLDVALAAGRLMQKLHDRRLLRPVIQPAGISVSDSLAPAIPGYARDTEKLAVDCAYPGNKKPGFDLKAQDKPRELHEGVALSAPDSGK